MQPVNVNVEVDQAQRDLLFSHFTIDRAPDAIFWIDAEARCRRVNEAACRMLGYSREELQSMKIHDFCPDHPPESWEEHWGHLRASKVRTFETQMRAKNGEAIPVEVSSNYLEFEGKEYTCAFVRDVRPRKKAEEAISQLSRHNEMILNAAGEGIFGLDLQGHHTFVNPAAASMLGHTREELLGRHSHSMWHHTKPDGSPYPGEECPIYKAYKDGQVHFGDDEVFWRKDGTSFPAQYASTPIRNEAGELVGAVVTFLDITERKRMAAQLLEEAKLAEVTRVLGDVGHDVKNMLMPVLNGAWLLQEELQEILGRLRSDGDEGVEASQKLTKEIIEMIVNNARRIQDRVREIADAVKGVTSAPKFAPCHLTKVAADVIETLRLYASEKGVTLHAEGLEALPPIEADERRLFNACYNLINNAVPEMPAGGSVTIRGELVSEGNMIQLSIADTGRGMPPEVRDSLFTTQTVSRKAGGTGLGTKIVKDVVDAHGGTITVESEEGVGSTFHIRLPIHRPKK